MSESETSMKKRNQTGYFKDKYYSKPEYKEKHMQKLKEKVKCETCDKMICRVNMNRHKKTSPHLLKEELLKLKNEKTQF
jgi:ribosomal protein L44E